MKEAAYDFAIIGGGVIGLSTAYALRARRRNAKICVIEAGPECGFGASWANGSMIHPSQSSPWAETGAGEDVDIAKHVYELAAYSSEILRARFDEFEIEPRHRRSSCAKIYISRAAMDEDLNKLETLFSAGLRAQYLSPVQIASRLNITARNIYGGVIFPDDHSGPARIYCQHLVSRLKASGVDFMTGDGAASIDAQSIGLSSGKTVFASSIIIAAGAQSHKLAAIAGQKAVRGYSRTFELPDHLGSFPIMPIMDDAAHIAIAPMGTHLRVSGGADDESINDSTIYERLETYLAGRCPELPLAAAPKSDWTALRPMSKSGPVIKRLRAGLYANTGHGHMGWTLSAGAAEKLVELIL